MSQLHGKPVCPEMLVIIEYMEHDRISKWKVLSVIFLHIGFHNMDVTELQKVFNLLPGKISSFQNLPQNNVNCGFCKSNTKYINNFIDIVKSASQFFLSSLNHS